MRSRRAPSMYKTPSQLRDMVGPGLATAASLNAVAAIVAPGVTTLELDTAAREAIEAAGAHPNFVLEEGYHHTICASINDEVVHGIPGARIIRAGDTVSIDSGAIMTGRDGVGWNGDAARTFVVPDAGDPERVASRLELSRVTEGALWHGLACLAQCRYLNDVGGAIEDFIRSQGNYGVITDYIGHGIGRSMHEDPPVFNYRVRGKGPEVRPGLVVAIEPMVVRGDPDTFVKDDGWTVATRDGRDAAHWEHSVAVHEGGLWVLTSEDGGAAGLAPFGVVPVPIS